MSKPELSCLDSENATAASALPRQYSSRALRARYTLTNPTVARIKRIVNVDDDVNRCSSDANFLIAVATELFIQYLVKQTSTVLKADRKARRTIQYKDVGKYETSLYCQLQLT